MGRSFNGTTDLIAVNAEHVTNGTTAFSISAWANKAAHAGDNIYSEGNSAAAGPFFEFQFDSTTGSHLEVQARDTSSGTIDSVIGLIVAGDSTWHHCCVTQTTGSVMQLYVDGVADTNGTRTANSNSNTQVFNRSTIGALVRSTTTTFYGGTLAHVALWTRTLSAQEVVYLAGGISPVGLAPAHYWPLFGADSPEPDIGAGAHVTGTLTGTTFAAGRDAASLLEPQRV